jgi:hypothetical protein
MERLEDGEGRGIGPKWDGNVARLGVATTASAANGWDAATFR